ncbi:hypothetical protein D9757_006199 [Collybiopsis confluens]|uniref:Uncharacterized protein n=1 Tax=Collybiopsis confluens TaxID=2823264 RepID=A0A8H5HJX3_9AGAR|nr:hypothetical protein D9757_006199 [Collybiopsis confluens]
MLLLWTKYPRRRRRRSKIMLPTLRTGIQMRLLAEDSCWMDLHPLRFSLFRDSRKRMAIDIDPDPMGSYEQRLKYALVEGYYRGLQDFMSKNYNYEQYIVPFGAYCGKRLHQVRDKPWLESFVDTLTNHLEYPLFCQAVQLWLYNPRHDEVYRDIGENLEQSHARDDRDLTREHESDNDADDSSNSMDEFIDHDTDRVDEEDEDENEAEESSTIDDEDIAAEIFMKEEDGDAEMVKGEDDPHAREEQYEDEDIESEFESEYDKNVFKTPTKKHKARSNVIYSDEEDEKDLAPSQCSQHSAGPTANDDQDMSPSKYPSDSEQEDNVVMPPPSTGDYARRRMLKSDRESEGECTYIEEEEEDLPQLSPNEPFKSPRKRGRRRKLVVSDNEYETRFKEEPFD